MASMSIAIQDIRYDSSNANYKLTGEATRKDSIATYKYLDGTISYKGQNFESTGVSCPHALKVLNLNNTF